jgi:SAM-dependent methyltransferase
LNARESTSPPVAPAAQHPGAIDLAIRQYWDRRIDDTRLSEAPWGTAEYFAAMDSYRLEKADYLTRVVDFGAWAGKEVLDVGCGAGLDLMRFARGGAHAIGIDIAEGALRLARQYCAVTGLQPGLVQADGARLPFKAASFDLVFCHGVLPFARDRDGLVAEARRVLRPSGEAIFMAYNRWSWVNALAVVGGMSLGHADAPVFRTYSRAEFEALLSPFRRSRIVGHRLPVASSRRRGLAGFTLNRVVAPAIRRLPSSLVHRFGWHWMAFCSVRD